MTPVFFFILNWQYRLFAKIDVYCMFDYLLLAFQTEMAKAVFLTQMSQSKDTKPPFLKKTSQELGMLSRSLSDCKSLLLNVMIQISLFVSNSQLCH